ncbi:sensor histidine kinase [Arenibaculum pallidiluteum]|uniref:sensor histidine kinase n=1 Tax=Arenibaculum pallidiluteum TaxID=2812559 RepID=UPI001A95C7D6|nr:ATP-binding protein [Arenibaculum pallidiluteum]
MENLLIQLLPPKPSSLAVRYGVTTALVGLTALLRHALDETLQGYPFLLFFPAIFLTSLLFDRASGFLAVAESALIALWIWIAPKGSLIPEEPRDWFPLILFVCIGSGIAALTEALRTALEKVAADGREREELLRGYGELLQEREIMIRELGHRVRNDLHAMLALLSLAERQDREGFVEMSRQLRQRISVISRVYDRLVLREREAAVWSKEFIEGLVEDLRQSMVGLRPVVVLASADDVSLAMRCATAIGLIVNELVTNAFKYAFPDGRQGRIAVTFFMVDGMPTLVVEDDGVGMNPDAAPKGTGLGTQLVRQLAAQNQGTLQIEDVPGGGLRVRVRFPPTCLAVQSSDAP